MRTTCKTVGSHSMKYWLLHDGIFIFKTRGFFPLQCQPHNALVVLRQNDLSSCKEVGSKMHAFWGRGVVAPRACANPNQSVSTICNLFQSSLEEVAIYRNQIRYILPTSFLRNRYLRMIQAPDSHVNTTDMVKHLYSLTSLEIGPPLRMTCCAFSHINTYHGCHIHSPSTWAKR